MYYNARSKIFTDYGGSQNVRFKGDMIHVHCSCHTQDISKVFFMNTNPLPANTQNYATYCIHVQCMYDCLTSVPVVLAAACIRSLNAVLYLALMTLNSSRNEKDGIT